MNGGNSTLYCNFMTYNMIFLPSVYADKMLDVFTRISDINIYPGRNYLHDVKIQLFSERGTLNVFFWKHPVWHATTSTERETICIL